MPAALLRTLLNQEEFGQVPFPNLGASISQVFDLLPIGMQIDDLRGHTLYVNARFTEMLGYTLGDIADPEDWFRHAYPDPVERAEIRRHWTETLANAAATGCEIPRIERVLTCKNGEKKVIEFFIRRIGDCYIYINTDVSDRASLVAEMHRLAFTDSLTNVGNRRSFFAAGEALIGAGRHPLAGLMVDLDHFKSLNDRFGHRIGDEALIEVAARCRAVLGEEQHLARLGGEEFGVLLPGYDRPAALAVAARLHHAVTNRPLDLPSLGQQVLIGTSIGVALAAEGEDGIDGLMARADRALYQAKRSGRNRVCCSDG